MMNFIKTHKKIMIMIAVFLFLGLTGVGTVTGVYALSTEEQAKTEDKHTTKEKKVVKKEDSKEKEITSEKVTPSEEAPEEKKESSDKKSEDSKDTKKTTDSKDTKDTNNTKESSKKEEKHTHNWIQKTTTIQHQEEGHWDKVLVKEAWTEERPIYGLVSYSACNVCQEDITGNVSAHSKAHALAGEGGGWHSAFRNEQTGTETITHPAEYKDQWVVDKAAWTETKTTWICSCGATK